MAQNPNVLMLGTGEYTTGWVGKASDSDKSTGVVALVMLDLKRRNKINDLAMCGTSGPKLPQIREHMRKMLGAYEGIDPGLVKTFPADDVVDREAYKGAISTLKKGDCAIIFTPDDTHFAIAEHCIKHGIHVMITKPPVKTLDEHNKLAALAKEQGVLCCIEVHKRYDPIYSARPDPAARRVLLLPGVHVQPKHQLETFKVCSGVRFRASTAWGSTRVDGVRVVGETDALDALPPRSHGIGAADYTRRRAVASRARDGERESGRARRESKTKKNDAGLGRQVVGHLLLPQLAPC